VPASFAIDCAASYLDTQQSGHGADADGYCLLHRSPRMRSSVLIGEAQAWAAHRAEIRPSVAGDHVQPFGQRLPACFSSRRATAILTCHQRRVVCWPGRGGLPPGLRK